MEDNKLNASASPVAMPQDQAVASQAEEAEIAIDMLARWCVAVDRNGTGWDDWDEHFKDAMYRPGPLREKLDAAIEAVRKEYGNDE